jgi:hypothetical protein
MVNNQTKTQLIAKEMLKKHNQTKTSEKILNLTIMIKKIIKITITPKKYNKIYKNFQKNVKKSE